MLGSLLFGALAGYLVVHAEPLIEALLDRALGKDLRLDAMDFRVLSFAVMLVLAGVATALARGDASLVLGAVGGGLGYFGTRIYAFLKDPDGVRGDPEDDWSGDVGAPERGAPLRDQDPDDEAIAAVRATLSEQDPVYVREPKGPAVRRGTGPAGAPSGAPAGQDQAEISTRRGPERRAPQNKEQDEK